MNNTKSVQLLKQRITKMGIYNQSINIFFLVFAYFPQSSVLYLFLINSNFIMFINIYLLFLSVVTIYLSYFFSTNR